MVRPIAAGELQALDSIRAITAGLIAAIPVTSIVVALGVVVIVVVSLVANGVLASIEDELPGGFNNPDGQEPLSAGSRRWVNITRYLIGVSVLVIVLWGAVSLRGAAGLRDRVLTVGLMSGAATFAAALLLARRPLLWISLVVLVAAIVVGGILR